MSRNEPAYRALADVLRTAVFENRQPDGQRLPTEAELRQQYGVSRHTVRRAYQDLVAEGIVHRIPGKGTFPAARDQYLRSFGSIEDLLALSIDTVLKVTRPLESVANPEAASRLGLQFDEVAEISFQRHHNDVPFCHTTVSLPLSVGRQLRHARFLNRVGGRSRTTILALLNRVLEKPITGAKQSITAVAAPESIADLIECQVAQPVLRIERLYFDADGRPVEFAVSYFNPSRYSYRLQLRGSTG